MDKVTEILITALKQALTRGEEQRLYRSGKLGGLFPSRAGSSADAAAQALRQGLLDSTRIEVKGKSSIEWVRLTPRGIDFLHENESPLHALHDLRATLRANQQAVPLWLVEMRESFHALEARLATDAQKWMDRLDALACRVEDTLRRLENATPLLPAELAQLHPWAIDALNYLDRRRDTGAPGECALPELFEAVTQRHRELSMGGFHDGLRHLHDRRVIRLKPAPSLDDLPRPEFALLDDGVILYYAGR